MDDDFKTKVYVIIFWVSLLVIAVWILLKALGYIQTPVLVEMMPYAGAIFAMGAFFQILYDLRKNVWKLNVGLGRVASEVVKTKMDVGHTSKRLDGIDKKLGIFGIQLDAYFIQLV